MNTVTFAAIVLAASLNAAPEKAAAPAAPAVPGPAKAAKPAKPLKASKEAIKDAQGALLGPCSVEMATTKVKSVSVIDGVALNQLIEKEKLAQAKADPAALFMVVEYDTGAGPAKDYRQVSTFHRLTTEQAQALVGQPMCVFGKAP